MAGMTLTLTPSRSDLKEMTVLTGVQITGAMSCYNPQMRENYDRDDPKNLRACLHAAAYLAIHGVSNEHGTIPDNPECRHYPAIEYAVREACAGGRYSAYYLPGEKPVRLSVPGARQLWAYYADDMKPLLIVLNDTDAAVKQKVTVEGLKKTGREVTSGEVFDFTSGTCELELGPREARFIRFE